jgi:hypothetical protein
MDELTRVAGYTPQPLNYRIAAINWQAQVVERRLTSSEDGQSGKELDNFVEEVTWHLPTLALIYVPR